MRKRDDDEVNEKKRGKETARIESIRMSIKERQGGEVREILLQWPNWLVTGSRVRRETRRTALNCVENRKLLITIYRVREKSQKERERERESRLKKS